MKVTFAFLLVALVPATARAQTLNCEYVSVSLNASSHASIDHILAPPISTEGGIIRRSVTAFEGEPLALEVGVTFSIKPPPTAVVRLVVQRNGVDFLLADFRERTQNGEPSDFYGADWRSQQKRLVAPPMQAGVYEFTAFPIGCDLARFPQLTHMRINADVRLAATERDVAQLHLYRARAALNDGHCEFAVGEALQVEKLLPGFWPAVDIRAECARLSGDLAESLLLYETLQGGRGQASRIRPDYSRTIFDVRRELKAKTRR